MQFVPMNAIYSRRSTSATLARHYLLVLRLRKMVGGVKQQIKLP
jgi:hypothetical protein